MVQWKKLFGLDNQDRVGFRDEVRRLLPSTTDDLLPSALPPADVTKVALRLKYQIEQVIPCQLEEWKVTKANSPIITRKVIMTARDVGGKEHRACVVYCLLVCYRWFKKQATLELWDADLHSVRATACEVLAKEIIEMEDDQAFLLQNLLLQRFSILVKNEVTEPANAVERAVDLHALRVIGSSGYQRCVSYLWRGWLVQDDQYPSNFIPWTAKTNINYWDHFDPDRMRVPRYQNAVQIFFSILYLALYTAAINTINSTGDLDIVEGILYLMTAGFVFDEASKFWKVGRHYIGFWNVFNSTLYALLATSFILRMVALGHPVNTDAREHFNELSYNFLAFSAPMFWMRLLLYLDTYRFFGAMLVVLKVMMKESLIFFALLIIVMVGFLQAFIGMDQVDDDAKVTSFILQAMANGVMQSPDFDGFENFAPPFGIILYYIFTFVVMVVLLNILIALYNSAYEDITDNAVDEYMALFSEKTLQFVRAPDENVFLPPFNVIEILFLIIPFEWWLSTEKYGRLNNYVMGFLYSPLLVVTAWFESREARKVRRNRRQGEEDDDETEEWEQLGIDGEEVVDFEGEGWAKRVEISKPNVQTDAAVLEARECKEQISELKQEIEGLRKLVEELVGKGEREDGSEEKTNGRIPTAYTKMPLLVKNAQIKSASLLNPLPLYLHTYVWPFLAIWPAFLAIYLSEERYTKYINGSEWTTVWAGSISSLQALIWLMTKWNVNVDALFTSTTARDVRNAKLIKVIPVTNAGSAEICKLLRDRVGGKHNVSFLFQKRRFLYDAQENIFAPLSYDIDKEPRPGMKIFQTSHGLTKLSEIDRIHQHYGDNTFDIPVPTFTELWKEHAVAPFFVFQMFCVGLWLLDDYWYYSLFTLVMLVGFESTVVWQRQRTLNEFRGMSIKPYDIWVHRENRWEQITSDKLLPGDLVSVGRTKEDSGMACDMLLVEGTAIVNEAMLSGESTPLLKDSIQLRPGDAPIDPEGLDKNAFIWGGTKVLQVAHGNATEDAPETVPTLASGVNPPPDNGAMAVIVKTGFETSQGSLVRTMIYSTERVSANNVEALLFILFLLIFAIAASWYVWVEGVAQDRKRSKLLLDCVLIVTSVVPPELPMELSLAVNTSLAALSKYAIFCTEPFRIPYAGRVDVACFDKTGTLTGEDLVVDGIAGLSLDDKNAKIEENGAQTKLTTVLEAGQQTTLVLATAHALVRLDEGEIVGDPMEKATLSSLGWSLGRNDVLTGRSTAIGKGNTSGGEIVQIKRRFQFSSSLKRQSSVATVLTTDRATNKKARGTFVGVKGAPETIRTMLTKTPPNYEETFKHFTRNGGRVLALGYRYLSTESELGQNKINNLKREEVEADLTFAGFLVLQCPLKEDAMSAVQMLNESSHRSVMITGDNPLTAVHVARQVEIIDRDVLILDAPEHDDSGEKLVWRSVDDRVSIPVDPTQALSEEIIREKDLCVTGYALSKYKNQPSFYQLLRYTWVYARVSPKQKEDILIGLRDQGYTTLMCGDGTNDVGALKQAHIGVALLNGSQDDLNKIAEHYRTTKMKEIYEKQINLMKRFNQPPPPVPVQIAHIYPPGPTNPHYEKAMQAQAERKGTAGGASNQSSVSEKPNNIETITSPGAKALQNGNANLTSQQKRQQEAQQKAAGLADKLTSTMMEQELDENEPPRIKLGDASVAAPFTSKLKNVIAIPNIIRQGRCTLVATIQMYKILALNCLISAYSLSVLYLDGIKFGDGQVTISGMLMSVCFLSISRAKSVEGLSKERPQPNIFNPYIIGSVLGQFAIHIATLIFISSHVQTHYEPLEKNPDLEGDFQPSLLNSAIYLLQLIQQISTFAINYQGRPFREGIRENKSMYYGIVGVSAVAFSCSTEFIPEINEKLRLVPFTPIFKLILTATMVGDYLGCLVIENLLKAAYSDFRPKDIAVRRRDQLEKEERRRRKELEEKMAAEGVS